MTAVKAMLCSALVNPQHKFYIHLKNTDKPKHAQKTATRIVRELGLKW
jgi:hypothetical protein